MRIDRSIRGEVDVLALTGDFDHRTVAKFDREVCPLIDDFRTRLVFDLSRVEFLDSAGLTRLIDTYRKLKPLGGESVIAGPTRFAQVTIRTAGVHKLIRVYPDADEAERHFTDPANAKALDMESVPVDEEKIGRVPVEFGIAGQDGAAEGRILSTYADGVLVRYPVNAQRAPLGHDDLEVGTKVWLRFRQPIVDPEREFELEAEVTLAHEEQEGRAKYHLGFTKIDDEARARMAELARMGDRARSHGRPPPD